MSTQSYREMGVEDPPMTADDSIRFLLVAIFIVVATMAMRSLADDHPLPAAPPKPFTIRAMIA